MNKILDNILDSIERKISSKVSKDAEGQLSVKLFDVREALQHAAATYNLSSDDLWIPCKEQEPTEFKKYLVTCRGIDIPQIRKFEGYWDSTYEVIAWQPLPKNYEPLKAYKHECYVDSKFQEDLHYLKMYTGYTGDQIGCFLCNYNDPDTCGRFNSSGCKQLAACKTLFNVIANKK